MPQFADRVKISSTTTGTGTLTLGSASSGFQSIPASLNGKTVGYVIENGSTWEIGTGTYTHSGTTLSRTYRSSSTGALLNLSGTSTIFLTPAAQDLQIVEAFSATSDLPSAGDNHGRIYHVHAEGAMYFAHGGSWYKLANATNATTSASGLMSTADKTKLDAIAASANNYVHPNHTGEVTSAADGATVIADNVVDEANLKVSNSPTNGYVLTAQSGNTGGLTWAVASTGGGGSSTSALSEQEFTATANQTVFTVSGGITNAANVAVFLNGSKLGASDYTASASGNTVTLGTGATVGDLVEISEFGQEAGGASVTSSDTAPSSPSSGDLWFDSTTGELLVWYVDGSSNQWVGVSGTAGPTGADGSAGSSVITKNSQSAMLAISSPSVGDMVYRSDNANLMMYNGTGWYVMATIQSTPTVGSVSQTTGGSTSAIASNGTFAMTAGSNTVVTISGADADEGSTLTYSATVTSGTQSNVLASLTQSANVFTLAPATSGGGTITIRFDVSDSASVGNQSASFNLSFATSIEFLVVAGGGGGGGWTGAGGGAGGYRTSTQSILPNTVITVTVGAGGTGGIQSGTDSRGTNGGNSSITGSGITDIVSAGGGAGGGYTTNSLTAGLDGGSGGGGGHKNGVLGGSASPSGQGNAGGVSSASSYNMGGGGGSGAAGNAGGNNESGGEGGIGTANSITGASVYYAGGGSGAIQSARSGTGYNPAPLGGGGNGSAFSTSYNGSSGTPNTGGGGGGTRNLNSGNDGGSGVVIMRMPTINYSGTTTGSPTVTTDGSHTVIKFTASGSYTV